MELLFDKINGRMFPETIAGLQLEQQIDIILFPKTRTLNLCFVLFYSFIVLWSAYFIYFWSNLYFPFCIFVHFVVGRNSLSKAFVVLIYVNKDESFICMYTTFLLPRIYFVVLCVVLFLNVDYIFFFFFFYSAVIMLL